MNALKAKYCYAIVNKKTNSFWLEDHKLPIYWSKKVAHDILNKKCGEAFTVVPVSFDGLNKFITNS